MTYEDLNVYVHSSFISNTSCWRPSVGKQIVENSYIGILFSNKRNALSDESQNNCVE